MQRSHYLARDPVWFLPLVALVANVTFLAWFLIQVHTAKGKLRVAMSEPGRVMARTAAIRVLEVAPDGKISVEGQPLATLSELEQRLSEPAAGQALILRLAPKVDATLVARLLQVISQAGFSDVLVEVGQEPKEP